MGQQWPAAGPEALNTIDLGAAGISPFERAHHYPYLGVRRPNYREGILEVVKQEKARVNIEILGISEPKWTRMGEFNSDGHYIYYCGQESLKKME